MSRYVAWSLVLALSLAACTGAGSSTPSSQASPAGPGVTPVPTAAALTGTAGQTQTLRLVTLGDAYTAGTETSSPKVDSWPAQLARVMRTGAVRVRLARNLAEPGTTSRDVLESQLGEVASWEPDVVTLQVGSNDIITHETESYRDNVAAILDGLLGILPPQRIFVVTTPDHTLTAWAGSRGPTEADRAAVVEVNDTLREVAAERGIGVIDISGVNRLVSSVPGLVIGQGPYPTAKQYAGWVEVIARRIRQSVLEQQP